MLELSVTLTMGFCLPTFFFFWLRVLKINQHQIANPYHRCSENYFFSAFLFPFNTFRELIRKIKQSLTGERKNMRVKFKLNNVAEMYVFFLLSYLVNLLANHKIYPKSLLMVTFLNADGLRGKITAYTT